MIIYKPNRAWWKDLSHLASSWTMVVVFQRVLIAGIYATAVVFGMRWLLTSNEQFIIGTNIVSLLGIVLSLLLVFRTNTAYDRWWEGRKQWGALVNNCRNLAVMVHATFPKEDRISRHFFAKYISNFCLALVEHLREGTRLDELLELTDTEKETYRTKKHIPNHIAMLIFQRVQETYRKGDIDEGDIINLKPQVQALLDVLGACERIKNTPIPFSYNVYLKVYLSIYTLVLPFCLFTSFGFFTIPVCMFVVFALLGVEMMAEEIEDPFGHDCNDLPTGTIAQTIQKNVFEILEDTTILEYTMEDRVYHKAF